MVRRHRCQRAQRLKGPEDGDLASEQLVTNLSRDSAETHQALATLARQKLRSGYRRLHAKMEKRGLQVTPQRLYRLSRA